MQWNEGNILVFVIQACATADLCDNSSGGAHELHVNLNHAAKMTLDRLMYAVWIHWKGDIPGGMEQDSMEFH